LPAGILPRDTESVQQRTTRLTLTRREFEAVVWVEGKAPAAEDVVALTVREATGQPLPPWEPGEHVDLILDDVATRQYSLCGPSWDQQAYRLGILRDPNGSGGSLHVHDKLAVGDLVRIRAVPHFRPQRLAGQRDRVRRLADRRRLGTSETRVSPAAALR